MNISRRNFLKGTLSAAAAASFMGMSSVSALAEENTEALGEAEETYEAEVVICGAGAAGLMAALQLTRAGVDVCIVEAGANAFGSNFSMCGGPAACETKLQAEEGEDLSVDKLFKYMYGFSRSSVNGRLLKKVLSCTGRGIDSMYDLGIPMELWPDVYDNGFRARHYFLADGKPRIEPIVNDIEANGGRFIYSAKAKEPIMEDSRVVGIKAVSGKKVIAVMGKAVLITTGGFLGNTEMQKKYFNTPVFPLGNTVSDGSGIELAHKAGAVDDRTFAVLGNECGAVSKATQGWPFTPDWTNKNEHLGYWLFGGLYTDKNGDRFIDEGQVAKLPLAIGGEALVRNGKAYCIMDSDYYEAVKSEGIYSYLGFPEDWVAGAENDWYSPTEENAEAHLQQAIEEDWAIKADSIEEIAEKFNLPHLCDTVKAYNEFCEKGEDIEFYKSATFLKPVAKAPFYAFEYVSSAWGTNGGIKVDACLQALDCNNEPIPGLFVAGVDIGSMYTQPYYDNPGSSVGLAVGSGVLAADEIIAFLAK